LRAGCDFYEKKLGVVIALWASFGFFDGASVAFGKENQGKYKKFTKKDSDDFKKKNLKKKLKPEQKKPFWLYEKLVSVSRYSGLLYPLGHDLFTAARAVDGYEDIDPRVAQILKGWAHDAGCQWAPAARIKLWPTSFNAANSFYLFSPRTPVFLINTDFWNQWNDRERRMIFLHECGHFEHKDVEHFLQYLFITRALAGGLGMKGVTEFGLFIKNHGRAMADRLPFSLAKRAETLCENIEESWVGREILGDQFVRNSLHLGGVILGLEQPRTVVECALGMGRSFLYGAAAFSLGQQIRRDVFFIKRSHEWGADRFALDHAQNRDDVLAFKNFHLQCGLMVWRSLVQFYAQPLRRMPQAEQMRFMQNKYQDYCKQDVHPSAVERMDLCDKYLEKYPVPLPASGPAQR